jgi:hypothetical protein
MFTRLQPGSHCGPRLLVLRLFFSALLLIAALPIAAASQSASATPASTKTVTTTANPRQQPRDKFVLDVVHSAVGLPQPDPQDRLRVLYAAANVVAPIDQKLSQQFAKEGTSIETKLVAEGQKPAVSMLATGHVDCASAVAFVQALPAAGVLDAEQSLLGAITNCPKQVDASAMAKVDAGVNQGVVAARAILALMEADGMKSQWSQAMFVKMFSSLPADVGSSAGEAPNYAAMFAETAPKMDKDAVKTAGAKFLLWLAKLPDSLQRSVAVNLTSGALSDSLGAAAYQELLRSDPMIQQTVSSAGQNAMLPAPSDDNVSVLRAMDNSGDRTQELNSMPAATRAREAAASGFASGSSGDRKLADHYFDIAFASVDEVWSDRSTTSASAPEVVEEVSEAAAQVDPVAALQRSQRLQDPSAEAISMLAVARVVVGQE